MDAAEGEDMTRKSDIHHLRKLQRQAAVKRVKVYKCPKCGAVKETTNEKWTRNGRVGCQNCRSEMREVKE